MVVASNDGTCGVAAVAGNGLAGDASLNGDHPSNPKRGCDVVQGCRVDRKEVDRKEVDRKEDHCEKVDREEEHGKEVDREEDRCEKVDRQTAGCRFEVVTEGRAA